MEPKGGRKRPESPTEKRPKTAGAAKPPLPRGYRIRLHADGREYCAQLIVGGKIKGSYRTEAEAREEAETLLFKERELGREVREFDPQEWRRYLAAKDAYWAGKEPDWALLGSLSSRLPSKTVSRAVADYEKARSGVGLASSTLGQMKTKLRAFSEAFGDRPLASVTPAEIREWLAGLTERGFETWTVRDYLKVVTTFWGFARREKWVLDNPCEAVEMPKVVPEEVNTLTPDETRLLIEGNLGQRGFGRLLLETFAGLRNSSAARLVYSDIDFVNKGINLPAVKHKSNRRHFVDGLPDCLWAWLKLVPASDFDSTPRQYAVEKANAFVRARVKSTHNCLRHSFASAHVAAFRNAAATAVILNHTAPAMLYRHYKGRYTEAQGLAYFAITPKA